MHKKTLFQVLFAVFAIVLFAGIADPALSQETTKNAIIQSPFKTPFDVAIDVQNNLVYSINIQTNDIVVIDGSNNQLLGEIQLQDEPWAIAFNNLSQKVFVTSFFGNAVYVIDSGLIARDRFKTNINPIVARLTGLNGPFKIISSTKTADIFILNSVSRTVTWLNGQISNYRKNDIKLNEEITDGVLNESLNKLFISHRRDSLIHIIEFSSSSNGGLKIGKIQIPYPLTTLVVDEKLQKIYGVVFQKSTLAIIDASRDKFSGEIGQLGNVNDSYLALNEKTHRLYLSKFWESNLDVIDTTTDKKISEIEFGKGERLGQPILNLESNEIYILTRAKIIFYIIDGGQNKIIGQKLVFAGLSGGTFLDQKMFNDKTRRLYIPRAFSSILTVYDASQDKVETIPAGISTEKFLSPIDKFFSYPASVVYDSSLNRIYFTNLSGFVTVLDGTSLAPLKTIKVGLYPASIQLLQSSAKLYVMSDYDNTLYIIDLKKDEVIKTLRLGDKPAGLGADYQIKYRQSTDWLTINERNNSRLYIIDVKTDSLIRSLDTSNTVGNSVAYNNIDKAFIRYDNKEGLIQYFDENDLSLKKEIKTFKGGVVMFAAGNKFYLFMPDQTIYVLGDQKGNSIQVLAILKSAYIAPTSQLWLPAQSRLYVGFRRGVEIIDTTSDKIIKSFNTRNLYNYLFAGTGDDAVYVYNYLPTFRFASKIYLYKFDKNDRRSQVIPIDQWFTPREDPAVDVKGHRIFLASTYKNKLLVVDTLSGHITIIPEQAAAAPKIKLPPNKVILGAGIGLVLVVVLIAWLSWHRRLNKKVPPQKL